MGSLRGRVGHAGRMVVAGPGRALVVDGANVVGSRPDGWWKDRARAAARLHDRLVRADLGGADVVLVLEGRARPGAPEGGCGRVRTRHARGDGDDAIVEEVAGLLDAGAGVDVVTADRALADRCRRLGAGVLRPGALLDRLP